MGILQSFVDGWNGTEDEQEESLFACASPQVENAPLSDDTKSAEELVRESKTMRENQSEQQIDKTLKDSFPASDPPAW